LLKLPCFQLSGRNLDSAQYSKMVINLILITNYRPIAIINNFAKIFEFILFERIYHHISSKISVNQHGFMARRSTVTNLVSTTQFLCESLDAHGQVDVIYMDLSKAFDRVNHRLLLYKLDDFGLSDGLILLIESYLQKRVQFVQYRGFRSESFSQTSGVPQGSVLGPLFFNIFINDLTSLLNENFQMYADDLKIYRTVSTLDDCSRLQKDLDIIQKWCNDNDQLINTKKCYVLTFSRKLDKIICDYWIGGVKILRATEFRDLGVVFDCGLTFRNHIEYVTSAAYKSLGFVLRNRRFIVLRQLYRFIRLMCDANWSMLVLFGHQYTITTPGPWRRFKDILLNFWYLMKLVNTHLGDFSTKPF
jgi:hypothetical protein